jgi:hypothetical protein
MNGEYETVRIIRHGDPPNGLEQPPATDPHAMNDTSHNCTQIKAALDHIHLAMDGHEWNADTADTIANILIEQGYTISPPTY